MRRGSQENAHTSQTNTWTELLVWRLRHGHVFPRRPRHKTAPLGQTHADDDSARLDDAAVARVDRRRRGRHDARLERLVLAAHAGVVESRELRRVGAMPCQQALGRVNVGKVLDRLPGRLGDWKWTNVVMSLKVMKCG